MIQLKSATDDAIYERHKNGHDGSMDSYIKWYETRDDPNKRQITSKQNPSNENPGKYPEIEAIAKKIAFEHDLSIDKLYIKKYKKESIANLKTDFAIYCFNLNIPIEDIAEFLGYSKPSIYRLLYRKDTRPQYKYEKVLEALKEGLVSKDDFHDVPNLIFQLRKKGYDIETVSGGYKLKKELK